MTLITIDRNLTLYGCSISGHTDRCFGCPWDKQNVCDGKEIHKTLLMKIEVSRDIDYDLLPRRKPPPECSANY